MAFFDFFRSKKQVKEAENAPSVEDKEALKKEIYRKLLEQTAQRTLSDLFVSGAGFDLIRLFHDDFEKAVRAKEGGEIYRFFNTIYYTFREHPEISGALFSNYVNKDLDDTDPLHWNISRCHLNGTDIAVACYMPIENDRFSARMLGVILADEGDAYYYAMIGKDENSASKIIRNKGRYGIEEIAIAKGQGRDFLESFFLLIQSDFYNSPKCFF